MKRDDYPPALLSLFQYQQGLYGLPYAIIPTTVLVYNPRLFDTAGLTYPNQDWTLDDLLNVAQQLTQAGDNVERRYGFVSLNDMDHDIRFFLNRAGAALVRLSDGSPEPNFTDQQVVQAIQRYVDLLRNASPHTRLETPAYINASTAVDELLAAGRVGMWLDRTGASARAYPSQPLRHLALRCSPHTISRARVSLSQPLQPT